MFLRSKVILCCTILCLYSGLSNGLDTNNTKINVTVDSNASKTNASVVSESPVTPVAIQSTPDSAPAIPVTKKVTPPSDAAPTNASTLSTSEKPPSNITVTPVPDKTTQPSTITPNTTTPSPITKNPNASTTHAPPPHNRQFDGPSFIGGIILTTGLMAISFVAFKFYKARTERNYHTL